MFMFLNISAVVNADNYVVESWSNTYHAFLQVCSDNWGGELSNLVCAAMGIA